MAPHSSIPAWRIPRTEDPVGYAVHGVSRVRYDLATRSRKYIGRGMAPHSRIPAWRIPQAGACGLHSPWGRKSPIRLSN